MNRSDKTRIADSLTIMATHWGQPMDGGRMKIYLEALIDLPTGAVEKGIGHLIKTRTFAGNIPVVAEIREAGEYFLEEEYLLLDGPPKKLRIVTKENAHLYANQDCPICGGKGSYEGVLPGMKTAGPFTIRCDCVIDP